MPHHTLAQRESDRQIIRRHFVLGRKPGLQPGFVQPKQGIVNLIVYLTRRKLRLFAWRQVAWVNRERKNEFAAPDRTFILSICGRNDRHQQRRQYDAAVHMLLPCTTKSCVPAAARSFSSAKHALHPWSICLSTIISER